MKNRGYGRPPTQQYATADHIGPTDSQIRPFGDELAEAMKHVIGPELGLTQPGMTIACGDSHTSTHGALGAIAFGIGTSQVRDVLATQTLAMTKPTETRCNTEGCAEAPVEDSR